MNEEISRTEEYITRLNEGQNETFLLDLLLSNGQVERCASEFYIWRTDLNPELDPSMADGVMEGAMYGEAGEPQKRKKLQNNCQIIKGVASVSGTAEALLDPLGLANHFEKLVDEELLKCKRTLNNAIMTGTIQDEDKERQIPRKMNGLLNMIDVVIDNEGKALSHGVLEDAMQKLWESGNSGDRLCLVNASAKKKINAMYLDAPEITLNVQAGNNTFGVLAKQIITDFGNIFIILDRNMPVDQIALIDPSQLVLQVLRPFEIKEPVMDGDFRKRVVIGEYGLKVRNCHAHVKILNFA
jgi:hypothetical protein